MTLNILVLGLFLVASSFAADLKEAYKKNTIIVETKNGRVLGEYGEKSHGNGKTLYWFKSIPFAEPPVNDLRFKAPVPVKNWTGILDARDKKLECVQGSNSPKGSEDCLYLSVFTEKKPNPKNKIPVMVWIYGGAFFGGAADFDDHSPDYLLDQDVIVVGIHYRVGLFGFLSTGDTVAPGNNGIRDQILALKWIKENIQNFGGDPDKITIFGQSAGSASVGYLVQIEQAKGLFNQAILQSGSTLSPWAVSNNLPAYTKALAKDLKISTKSSQVILDGLKKIPADELQKAASSRMIKSLVTSNPVNGLVLTPVIEPEHEHAIITGKSHESLSNGNFSKVPLMVGYTSLEGAFDSLNTLIRLWLARFDLNPSLLVPKDMNIGLIRQALLGVRVKYNYFGLLPIVLSSKRVMRYVGDTQFEKPIQESIRQYAKYTNVFAYYFAYQGALYGIQNRTVDGVGHTEDLGYIFDFGHKGSEADYLNRDRVVKLWTNFAKYGNPTPTNDDLLQEVIWPEVDKSNDDIQFLKIDKHLSIIGLPNADNINFWRKMYKNYGNPPYSTY